MFVKVSCVFGEQKRGSARSKKKDKQHAAQTKRK